MIFFKIQNFSFSDILVCKHFFAFQKTSRYTLVGFIIGFTVTPLTSVTFEDTRSVWTI